MNSHGRKCALSRPELDSKSYIFMENDKIILLTDVSTVIYIYIYISAEIYLKQKFDLYDLI